MALIKTDWVSARDRTAADIVARGGDISGPLDSADASIRVAVGSAGVPWSSIPVDEDGYITSMVLREYGILVALEAIFRSWWHQGGLQGGGDVYVEKLRKIEFDRRAWESRLTADTILGPTLPDGGQSGGVIDAAGAPPSTEIPVLL